MDKREAIKPEQTKKSEKTKEFVKRDKTEGIISLLFDIILNKNKDATNKLKLLKEEKSQTKSGISQTTFVKEKAKESIDEKIKIMGKDNDASAKKPEDGLKPELNLPKLRYFKMEETPKLDYGSLFSYFGKMFEAKYDEYKAFKYDGEGRIEMEFAVEQRKYERIVEKEMMAEFQFFALDHIKPEEKEAYEWDRIFGFRKAIIYLSYHLKAASLRVIPGMEYSKESQEIRAINSP